LNAFLDLQYDLVELMMIFADVIPEPETPQPIELWGATILAFDDRKRQAKASAPDPVERVVAFMNSIVIGKC
jgi:hypothetical protein